MSKEVKSSSTKPTFALEHEKHFTFFKNVPNFEECFSDIYPFELKAQQELLDSTMFNGDYYARCCRRLRSVGGTRRSWSGLRWVVAVEGDVSSLGDNGALALL